MPLRLVWFGAACGGAAVAAVLFYPAIRARRGTRLAALVILAAVILTSPLLVPADTRLLRCVAAIVAATAVLKLYDLHLGAARGDYPGFGSFVLFLTSIFSLVHRKLASTPRAAARDNLARLFFSAVLFLLAAAVFVASFTVPWTRFGFAAEHSLKTVAFFLALIPLTALLHSTWELIGARGLAFMNNPFAARTPADFWRRYNRPVHQFLNEDVFVPVGGRRFPARGAIAVFVVSAVVHEYVFSMAVGRVQGYQTLFFLVQGIAVAATIRLKPRGPAAVASVIATFAFNIASGVLFFASVNAVVPFYENDVPLRAERGGGRADCSRGELAALFIERRAGSR